MAGEVEKVRDTLDELNQYLREIEKEIENVTVNFEQTYQPSYE